MDEPVTPLKIEPAPQRARVKEADVQVWPTPPAAAPEPDRFDPALFNDSPDLPPPAEYTDRSPPKRRCSSTDYRIFRASMMRKFEGDRLPCARCGKPIQYNLTEGPWRPEMGHIIPVAEWPEGEMIASNTAPEHRRCNRQGISRTQGPPV